MSARKDLGSKMVCNLSAQQSIGEPSPYNESCLRDLSQDVSFAVCEKLGQKQRNVFATRKQDASSALARHVSYFIMHDCLKPKVQSIAILARSTKRDRRTIYSSLDRFTALAERQSEIRDALRAAIEKLNAQTTYTFILPEKIEKNDG